MDMIDKWCVKKREIKKKKNIGLIYFFYEGKWVKPPNKQHTNQKPLGKNTPLLFTSIGLILKINECSNIIIIVIYVYICIYNNNWVNIYFGFIIKLHVSLLEIDLIKI